jgi:ABC-2 type transport system permease protein
MLAEGRFRAGLRVTFAIAVKDIVDAIRNRTTLSTILSVLFVMVAYRMLPSFESADTLPRLALYDAGESRLVAELEKSFEFDTVPLASQELMEAYVGDKDIVMLGLVLPADFDQRLASSDRVELDGYVVHWADDTAAANVRIFFEKQLTALAGRPLRINIAGNTVYTQMESRGYALLAALSVVIGITIVGVSLVPNIMLEEKQAKTLDVLLVSPASAGQVVIGKALVGLFYCLTATAVALIFNMALVNQWGLAILAVICGSLFTVGLGLLLGSMIETRGQLMLWAWVLIVPLLVPVFLSIMTDLLPADLITALGWIPTVALSKVLRISFSDSAPLAQFGPELAIVIGWSALILFAVAWLVRRSDK